MILVTGARGFIGQNLMAQWEGEEVRTLDARLEDEAALRRAVEGVHTIVHLASKNVDRDGSGFETTNVEGTRRLASSACTQGVTRILYVSTCGVYGHGAHVEAAESVPVAPDTAFSRSKAAAEAILLEHHAKGELEAVVLRHRFVYGPGDQHFVPGLTKLARRGRPVPVSGRARMSLIHVADLGAILRKFCDPDVSVPRDPVFHATDGRPRTLRDVVTALSEAVSVPTPPFIPIPFPVLYYPLRLIEKMDGRDPDAPSRSLTSVRLLLFGKDHTFSNEKLRTALPEITFRRFEDSLQVT